MTIKELRKAKKLSQAAFAAELGIAAVTVSQLETGRMKLSQISRYESSNCCT